MTEWRDFPGVPGWKLKRDGVRAAAWNGRAKGTGRVCVTVMHSDDDPLQTLKDYLGV